MARFAKIPLHVAAVAVSAGAFRVLIAIASHADRDGRGAHPSLARLAAETKMGRKNLPRLVAELEAGRIIRRERRTDDVGRPTNTYYTVVATDHPDGGDVLNPEDTNGGGDVLYPEDTNHGDLVSSELRLGVLRIEPLVSSELRTPSKKNRTFNRERTERAGARRVVENNQDGLLASGAVAPLPASVDAEEKALRRAVWQSKIINYARDRKPPEAFRGWCEAFIMHADNPHHWSVKEANRLSAEMKARKRGDNRALLLPSAGGKRQSNDMAAPEDEGNTVTISDGIRGHPNLNDEDAA